VPSSWTHIFVGRQVEVSDSRADLPLPACELPFWNKWMCEPGWNDHDSYKVFYNPNDPSSSEEEANSDHEGGHSEDEQECSGRKWYDSEEES